MSLVKREEIISYMEHDAYRPLTAQELAEVFQVTGTDDSEAFVGLLNNMEDLGDVVRTRAHRYGIPERMNLVVGSLQMKARGFGFVIPEVSGETDVYVSAGDLNGAMSGDRVMVRVEKSTTGPRREGKVIRVLERFTNRAVGGLVLHGGYAFVTPLDKRLNQDIFIPAGMWLDAHDGDVVVVEITEFPTSTRGPEGKVIEVLGNPDAPGVDILAIVRKYDLPEAFPPEVLAAAENIAVELREQDYEGRRDLRSQVIVTIDGEDAKDLDDAVHVHRLENSNYLLGVHIADVGYYVPYGTDLDQEAFRRGTSVYLVDRVIPMLPQRLSNGICSLNPRADRLTLSCEMEVTPTGEIVHHEVFPSVIRTTERMTYTAVRKILVDHDADLLERYRDLVPMFQMMEELAAILRDRRMRRGAIDFDFDEVKVKVDDLGRPLDLTSIHRSVAERLIEEFMLAANETVAEHFHWLNVPFVYRVHESPDLVKMQEFNEFISNFGYHVRGVNNQVHPRALQSVLRQVADTREEPVISRLMLRSMRQARYAPECLGHFGLAAEYYTHFTSPIRRYPDLTIHRIMREVLTGALSPQRQEHLADFVAAAAKQSSLRERVAQDAERETDQLKMVEYMLDHLGETFNGTVSGVTQFGLFIHLSNGVEGLIHVSYLTDDYYVLNEKQMALVGERTRRVFRLGDPVQVEVINANKEALTIDFALLAHHREGTLVKHGGVELVEYDEELSPKERNRRVEERNRMAKERDVTGKRSVPREGNRDFPHQGERRGDSSRGTDFRRRDDSRRGGEAPRGSNFQRGEDAVRGTDSRRGGDSPQGNNFPRRNRPERSKLAGAPALARELGRRTRPTEGHRGGRPARQGPAGQAWSGEEGRRGGWEGGRRDGLERRSGGPRSGRRGWSVEAGPRDGAEGHQSGWDGGKPRQRPSGEREPLRGERGGRSGERRSWGGRSEGGRGPYAGGGERRTSRPGQRQESHGSVAQGSARQGPAARQARSGEEDQRGGWAGGRRDGVDRRSTPDGRRGRPGAAEASRDGAEGHQGRWEGSKPRQRPSREWKPSRGERIDRSGEREPLRGEQGGRSGEREPLRGERGGRSGERGPWGGRTGGRRGPSAGREAYAADGERRGEQRGGRPRRVAGPGREAFARDGAGDRQGGWQGAGSGQRSDAASRGAIGHGSANRGLANRGLANRESPGQARGSAQGHRERDGWRGGQPSRGAMSGRKPGRGSGSRGLSGFSEQAGASEGFDSASDRGSAGRDGRKFSHGKAGTSWGPSTSKGKRSPGFAGKASRGESAGSGQSRGAHSTRERSFVPSGRPGGKNKGKHTVRRAH